MTDLLNRASKMHDHLQSELAEKDREIEDLRAELFRWKKSFSGHVYVTDEKYGNLADAKESLLELLQIANGWTDRLDSLPDNAPIYTDDLNRTYYAGQLRKARSVFYDNTDDAKRVPEAANEGAPQDSQKTSGETVENDAGLSEWELTGRALERKEKGIETQRQQYLKRLESSITELRQRAEAAEKDRDHWKVVASYYHPAMAHNPVDLSAIAKDIAEAIGEIQLPDRYGPGAIFSKLFSLNSQTGDIAVEAALSVLNKAVPSLVFGALKDRDELKAAAKVVHDRMHYLFETDCDGEIDRQEVRQCIDEFLEILGRAIGVRRKKECK